MAKDLDLQNKNWESLAVIDPYWAILVEDEKINNKWEVEKFYNTGKIQISKILSFLHDKGIVFQENSALDYGCGAGRLTEALGNLFTEVYGVDFSHNMINLANRHNSSPNIKYRVSNGSDLRLFQDGKFDFILSLITLQHSPDKIQYGLIREMMRTCSLNGIIIFSAVTHLSLKHSIRNIIAKFSPSLANYLLAWRSSLRNRNLGHYKENVGSQIFNVNPRKIYQIARENGFNVLYYASVELNWKNDDPLETFILVRESNGHSY